MNTYRHQFTDDRPLEWPAGKVVCVGRNYAEHARELENEVPDRPLLFIKPATAIVSFSPVLTISRRFGPVDYETEMTVLIGRSLCCEDGTGAGDAIAGVGVGLDLTRRELQHSLKKRGHPWERAKAFDGSCVLSPFAPFEPGMDLQNLAVNLRLNGHCVQKGHTAAMLFPVAALIAGISSVFSLEPGDVVMTGTPPGVGRLNHGDELAAELGTLVRAESRVVIQ